jgi:hypothetical protein
MDVETVGRALTHEPLGAGGQADRSLLRFGGWALVAGALLGMVGNLVHPATPTDDPEGVARAIAESGAWIGIHLTIVVGLVLMLGGIVALARAIRPEGGTAGHAATLAEGFAVAGVTIGLILVTLDGLAAKHLADAWVEAPAGERAVALGLVTVEETINFALAALFNIVFAGVTFILLGLAVARSDRLRDPLGWIVLGAGVGSIVVGLVQASIGESTAFSRALTIVFPTVITLWLAIMGAKMLRLARSRKG